MLVEVLSINTMITLSILKQPTGIKNKGKLGHIITNEQRVLKLSTLYQNYPYVEEFTKDAFYFSMQKFLYPATHKFFLSR